MIFRHQSSSESHCTVFVWYLLLFCGISKTNSCRVHTAFCCCQVTSCTSNFTWTVDMKVGVVTESSVGWRLFTPILALSGSEQMRSFQWQNVSGEDQGLCMPVLDLVLGLRVGMTFTQGYQLMPNFFWNSLFELASLRKSVSSFSYVFRFPLHAS